MMLYVLFSCLMQEINYQLTILLIYALQSPQEASVDSLSVLLPLHLKLNETFSLGCEEADLISFAYGNCYYFLIAAV